MKAVQKRDAEFLIQLTNLFVTRRDLIEPKWIKA